MTVNVDDARTRALAAIERSERHYRLAFAGAVVFEALLLGGLLVAADLSNRTHLMLLVGFVGSYSVVALAIIRARSPRQPRGPTRAASPRHVRHRVSFGRNDTRLTRNSRVSFLPNDTRCLFQRRRGERLALPERLQRRPALARELGLAGLRVRGGGAVQRTRRGSACAGDRRRTRRPRRRTCRRAAAPRRAARATA